MKRNTLMSWSSGKDSAWALYRLQQDPSVELTGIFCTVNSEFDRVAMHGVRLELLQRQASSLGLPLEIIELPFPCSNADYELIMAGFVESALARGVECIGFGDLFLEDVRNFRIEKLRGSGISPLFPLWGHATDALLAEMLDGGLRAITTCIDPKQLSEDFLGREIDIAFLQSLPSGVDPCGENGEFHSFVFDGPMFRSPIDVTVGEFVHRDGFTFADLRHDAI